MAKSIMIQGTASNVGKSLLCAGLCRVFRQDGYAVAPFKSQNMALNSFITDEGLEMGRAQAVQAQCAGVRPSVMMNPILLKPSADCVSQVIVSGEVLGSMNSREYFQVRPRLIPEVAREYASLAEKYDIIVIEGAGSPAEINLKQDDIVNMGMAKLAGAPVLLVGDIDRDGVFAQLYGTLALLSEDERSMVKATVVNKFRGDLGLFADGRTMLRDLTQMPVAGVIPYLSVDIDDEDSLAGRLDRRPIGAIIDVAVIRLPRISNFTDFAALESMPGIGVRYVRGIYELGLPDMVVLPGTKSTIADLIWMRESGLEAGVKKLAETGVVVFGICGGYQMLGEYITDAENAEGGGEIRAMELLPGRTEFSAEKCRTRVNGTVGAIGGALRGLSGARVEGYEIHMGLAALPAAARPLVALENGMADGCCSGNVYGTYLHGFFDSDACRSALYSALCEKKGVTPAPAAFDYQAYRERQYDLLADKLRQHLDIKLIYRILEEGICSK